jgi:hypothetical protein
VTRHRGHPGLRGQSVLYPNERGAPAYPHSNEWVGSGRQPSSSWRIPSQADRGHGAARPAGDRARSPGRRRGSLGSHPGRARLSPRRPRPAGLGARWARPAPACCRCAVQCGRGAGARTGTRARVAPGRGAARVHSAAEARRGSADPGAARALTPNPVSAFRPPAPLPIPARAGADDKLVWRTRRRRPGAHAPEQPAPARAKFLRRQERRHRPAALHPQRLAPGRRNSARDRLAQQRRLGIQWRLEPGLR